MDGSAKVSLILEIKDRIKAGLGKAKAYVNANVKEMKDKLSSLKTSHIQAFSAMKDELPGFGRAIELLANPYALVTAAVLALGVAYGNAARSALDWEAKLAHANVTAQETPEGLKKISDQLKEIAGRNVVPFQDVADGFNKIISAGLTVKQSMEVLEPTLRAAKAGFTDLTTTAEAGVAVMNASGENIHTVYDVLFATLNKGTKEFKDIAQYLPKVIPNAIAAGFSLKETAGAWAELTDVGRSAENSTTGLVNLFKQMANPSTSDALKDIGVHVYDLQGKTRPLINIVTDLSKKLDGLSDRKRNAKLSSIGLDMESIGAMNSMIQHTKELKEQIDFVTNSNGQLDASYKNAEQSTDSWRILINKVGLAFETLGETALPVIKKLGNYFLKHTDEIKLFGYTVAGVAAAWGTYAIVTSAATVATGLLTGAMWLLDVAMNANPIGILITGIGALIGVMVYAYKKSDTFRASLDGIFAVGKSLIPFFKSLGEVMAGVFDPQMLIQGVHDLNDAIKNIGKQGGISGIYDNAWADSMHESYKAQKQAEQTDAFADNGKTKGKTRKLDNSPEADSETAITGKAKQIKNITVNIDAFVKGGINSTNTNGLKGMSATDIEKWFNDMLMRAIVNLEESYT